MKPGKPQQDAPAVAGDRSSDGEHGSGKMKPGERYFTRAELARILKVSVRKVDSMIAYREIPVLRLGKLVRFRLEDVERVLNETMLTGKETFNPPTA